MKKQLLAIFSALIIAVLFTACGMNDMKNEVKDDMSSIESAIDNPSMQNKNNSRISADEAKSIALKHAGFKEDEVTTLHCKHENDDGISKYEVDFTKGNKEYDYDINAETGEIISYDHDID